jgi:enediyne biosynthesis protein E4
MRIAVFIPAIVSMVVITLHRGEVQAGSTTPVFRDVAGRLRFSYISNNHFTGRKYFPQPLCGGVAILDFDGDGRLDIFFTNGAAMPAMKKTGPEFHNCLLRNRGGDMFIDVTETAGLSGAEDGYGYGVAAGDYDNDGHTDLFICNAGVNKLYRNTGRGTFEDVTGESGAGTKPEGVLTIAAAFLDYDRDGWLDLVTANYTRWTPESDKRCVRDGVDYYCHPGVYESVPQRLYRNLGNGRFEDVTERSGFGSPRGKGMGLGIVDVNGDGWTDIFIANDTERNFLYLNRRDGTFEERGLQYGVAYNEDGATVSAMGADVRDYDNDGAPDIFYNNLMGQTWALFRNRGGRAFQDVAAGTAVARLSRPYSGWGGGFIDFNNDGWKDIYSANGDVDNLLPNARQHDTLFENTGAGFRDVSAGMGADFLRKGFQRGSAFADLNNDGAMDIVVTSLSERPRILMNTGASGSQWLLLDLRGRSSARDAIGASVKVITSSGRVLHNHVAPSVGLMSTSDRRVHFGLGADQGSVDIEITWPRGIKQKLKGVRPNRVLHLEEPAEN